MKEISDIEALAYYRRLPLRLQVGTLSPQYVHADSLRDETLKELYLVYEEDDKFWLLSAHKMHVPNSEYFAISSPYGYGGPICGIPDHEFMARAWVSYMGWCWENLIIADIMKLHPLVAQPYFGKRKFDRFTYTCGTSYSASCRNKINKARAHKLEAIQIDTQNIYQGFLVDYHKAMQAIKADEFYFFNKEYFRALSEIEGVCLIVCEEEEFMRSASIMFAGGLMMESHLTITTPRGREVGATNYLIHTARETLREEMPLFLGGGKTKSDEDPLAKFKASFGGDALPFTIGWQIHRPDVYNEMKQGNDSEKVLFWR